MWNPFRRKKRPPETTEVVAFYSHEACSLLWDLEEQLSDRVSEFLQHYAEQAKKADGEIKPHEVLWAYTDACRTFATELSGKSWEQVLKGKEAR